MWPQLTIEPSVNIDPAQPLATQFVVSNTGHVPVYDLRFACGFGGGKGSTQIGRLVIGGSAPVAVLPPGKGVTRSCALESRDTVIPSIRVNVAYRWPVIGIGDGQYAMFKITHGSPGFFLVPDFP
jgi:hypothetical protein